MNVTALRTLTALAVGATLALTAAAANAPSYTEGFNSETMCSDPVHGESLSLP